MLCLYSDPNLCITFCKQNKKKRKKKELEEKKREKKRVRSQVGEKWIGRGFGAT